VHGSKKVENHCLKKSSNFKLQLCMNLDCGGRRTTRASSFPLQQS